MVTRSTLGAVFTVACQRGSDEDAFIASDGTVGVYTFDVGGGYLITDAHVRRR